MGPAVHLRLTREWAIDEGFSPSEAELIARADLAFDARYPARARLLNSSRHFAPSVWLWSAHYLRLAARWGDLMLLGWALHCAQDGVAHGRLGTRHLVALAGFGKSPDVWESSSRGIKRRTERVTRARLRRYRASRGAAARVAAGGAGAVS